MSSARIANRPIQLGIALLLLAVGVQPVWAAAPAKTVDIANLTAGSDPLIRVSGAGVRLAGGLGRFGLPVAGGPDVDGDGNGDYAVAHMISSPLFRPYAGEVNLVFGDGSASEAIDLAVPQTRYLRIVGGGSRVLAEMTGSEIWIDDVTGDGLGDLLICRQNFSPGSPGLRLGAGALTVVVGGPELRTLADRQQVIDLAAPPPEVTLFTLLGASSNDRLGIWVRAGDVTGDGIADLALAADQESDGGFHRGAIYLVRGGSHLAVTNTVDLANFGASTLAGNIARITPPPGDDLHFGATLQLGDLNGNGRAELLAAATLNRAGASFGPFGPNTSTTHGAGGPPGGRFFIVWDDAFPGGSWPAGLQIDLASTPGVTTINGGAQNNAFGEEILGGLDYDGDGRAELFLGDLTASVGGRPTAGIGYVFYRADRLRGRSFNIDSRPPGIEITRILGPTAGAIGSDTVAQGDFDGDGFGDLMIGSPHANPQGRMFAGAMHVLYGREGGWPAVIDTAPGAFPTQDQVRITEIQGALGRTGSDEGDTLCYSAAAGDINGDGKTDVITNEMVGNGIAPGTIDAGNLIVLSGSFISPARIPPSTDPPQDDPEEDPEEPPEPPEPPGDPPDPEEDEPDIEIE